MAQVTLMVVKRNTEIGDPVNIALRTIDTAEESIIELAIVRDRLNVGGFLSNNCRALLCIARLTEVEL